MKFRKIQVREAEKIQTILKLVIFEFPDKLIWITLRNVLNLTYRSHSHMAFRNSCVKTERVMRYGSLIRHTFEMIYPAFTKWLMNR